MTIPLILKDTKGRSIYVNGADIIKAWLSTIENATVLCLRDGGSHTVTATPEEIGDLMTAWIIAVGGFELRTNGTEPTEPTEPTNEGR